MIIFMFWMIFFVQMVYEGKTTNAIENNRRELIPLVAPQNVTLLNFDSNGNAIIEWEPIPPKSVRGNFRGYVIRIWNQRMNQVHTTPPEITQMAIKFFPFSKNFITVSARNYKYIGPRSEAISFDAPQTAPGLPELFNYTQLGFRSALLQWNKPINPNGILLGYNLYCNEHDNGSNSSLINEQATVHEFIHGADNTQVKITGLKQEIGKKYQIQLSAVNCAGEGERNTIFVELDTHLATPPSKPSFKYTINYSFINETEKCNKSQNTSQLIINEDTTTTYSDLLTTNPITDDLDEIIKASRNEHCYVKTLIKWIPDLNHANPGEYFYIKYRIKGNNEWINTSIEYSEDFFILDQFNACENYEIVLIVIDGDFHTESDLQETPAILFPLN